MRDRAPGPAFVSCLYRDVVTHVRVRPRRHRLRYRIFQMLLDLDELEALDRSHRPFAYNRPGLLSFHDRDHGPGDGLPLRAWVEAKLAQAGLEPPKGPIRLLAMPRVLGRAFNPLSLFFCHRPDGALAAIVHEVNNTFGERHAYVLPVQAADGGVVRQACDKELHVSPFMDMKLRYDFEIRPPGAHVFVGVKTSDVSGPVLLATLEGERVAISEKALLSAVIAHPLLAAKVLGAIHWEALKLLLKGLRLQPRAPAGRRAPGQAPAGPQGLEPTARPPARCPAGREGLTAPAET